MCRMLEISNRSISEFHDFIQLFLLHVDADTNLIIFTIIFNIDLPTIVLS